MAEDRQLICLSDGPSDHTDGPDEARTDEDDALRLVDELIHKHYQHLEVSGEDQG